MKKRMTLIISIGAGILAVILFQYYLKSERNKLFEGMKIVEVAAVNHDFPAGSSIEESYLEKKEIPARYLHDKEVLFSDVPQIIGQPLRYPVKSGEILLWTGISGKRDNTLSGRVVKGERGITLGVDEIDGVNGLIHSGDRIDILGTFFAGGLGKEAVELKLGEATVMLLQNVLVLATGSHLRSPGTSGVEENNGYSGITVSVTPGEAALLVLAQQRGKLTMILRNFGDRQILPDLPKVTYDDIKLGKELRSLLKERNQRVIEVPSEAPSMVK
ncbi:MAG: Flp pilus assembly protein CpaB [Nitrospiria bacterium]